MQTQAKFWVCFTNINTKFFFCEPKLPLIPNVGPSPNNKNLSLWLSAWDDELLTTPKIITFQAASLSEVYENALSNIIP